MTSPALESAFAGLTVAGTSIMACVIRAHVGSAWAWFRHGFEAPAFDRRKAASVIVFAGLVPYGVMQLVSRTMHWAVTSDVLAGVNFFGWTCFCYGPLLWQASMIAETRGARAGRVWLLVGIAAALTSTVALGLLEPFHSPAGPSRALDIGARDAR